MKKTHATINVEVNVDCPICDSWIDVSNQFYGADDPVDPFIIKDRKEEYTVCCYECNNEFIIEELEF